MTGWLAGIDLGGTLIKGAIADPQGEIRVSESIPTRSHEGPPAVLARIVELLQRLAGQAAPSEPRPVLAVGFGVPGLVDLPTGTTRFLPNLPTQWRGVPVAQVLRQQLGCPVRLLNDVRTATLGELRFGHGREHPQATMAFFSIGTGIGGGVAIDGKLRLGPLGAAGELGHQTLIADGPRCGCGNRGCLEALASGPAIVAEAIRLMLTGQAPQLHQQVAGDAARVTPRTIGEAIAAGDEPLREAVERAATWIGIAAANVVTVLHPEWVVLGGGVAELGELLLEPVRRMLHERVGMFPTDEVRVVRSLLGDQAGIAGAIALAQQALAHPEPSSTS